MKRIISYILLATILLANAACNDFLAEESKTEMNKKNYMNDAAEAKTVLLGVYQNMVDNAAYGYHLSILFTMGTDISQVEGNSNENFRIIPTNSFSANQKEIQDSWEVLYNAIYNANDFLETIEAKMANYSEGDKKLAQLYIGEARGLRALYYFELLRRYGHIPLMSTTAMSNQDPATFVQEEPAAVYQFIEADLLAAIDALPYVVDDTERGETDFRLSKGAALGLLTKVYATWAGFPVLDESKWEKAAQTAQVLISSGKHSLLNNYEQLWKNSGAGVWNPTESLIEVSFYSPTASMSSDPIGRIGKWNGVKTDAIPGVRGSCAGNVKAVHSFVLDWREYPQDLRRDISVANYRYDYDAKTKIAQTMLWVQKSSDADASVSEIADADPLQRQKEKQFYTPAKWDIEKYVPQSNILLSNDKSNVNWYVLRYADVLLLYAEAMNEWKNGPTAEAYEAINMVRRRGYGLDLAAASPLADLPTGLSLEDFRQAVRQERAFELSFEGHRRLDLVRWGVYYSTVKSTAKALGMWWESGESPNYAVAKPGYTTEGKHELYPIPQREKDLTKFIQNPMWD